MLTLLRVSPCQQCCLNGDRGIQPGLDVHECHTDFLRAAACHIICLTGHAHEPRHALNDKIITWLIGSRTVLPKACD